MNFVAPEPTAEERLASSIQHGKTEGIDEWLGTRGLDALEAVRIGDSEMNVLHVACFYGNLDAVVRLLEYFPVDRPTKGGNTCAHLAAMNGHSAVVDLLVEKGASVGVKNLKGQNVFDVAQGLQLRQNLMKLVLAEEQRNGTAPVIAGVTRDMSKDQERLKNLPPPPTTFGPPPTQPTASTSTPGHTLPSPPIVPPQYAFTPSQAQMARPNESIGRTIQPDGFVTTVGNPNLAAKYGNQTQARLASDVVNASNQAAAWTPPTIQTAPPVHTAARYVVNTPGINVLPSTRPAVPGGAPNPAVSYRPPAGPYANKVKVFNPADFAQQQAPAGSQPDATAPVAPNQQQALQ